MSTVGPLGGDVRESESVHHQCLETSTVPPWEVLPKNLGVPSINARKRLRRGPWEVLPENPGVLTINARKHRWRPPWEVLPENPAALTINARK
jgi:hypothetical protein